MKLKKNVKEFIDKKIIFTLSDKITANNQISSYSTVLTVISDYILINKDNKTEDNNFEFNVGFSIKSPKVENDQNNETYSKNLGLIIANKRYQSKQFVFRLDNKTATSISNLIEEVELLEFKLSKKITLLQDEIHEKTKEAKSLDIDIFIINDTTKIVLKELLLFEQLFKKQKYDIKYYNEVAMFYSLKAIEGFIKAGKVFGKRSLKKNLTALRTLNIIQKGLNEAQKNTDIFIESIKHLKLLDEKLQAYIKNTRGY